MSATKQPAEVWRTALADGSGRHVPVRKHWPELAAALDAEVDRPLCTDPVCECTTHCLVIGDRLAPASVDSEETR
jgi:hypothetical protein